MLYEVITSLKTDDQIFSQTLSFIPDPPRWRNYLDALREFSFGLYFKISSALIMSYFVGVSDRNLGSSRITSYNVCYTKLLRGYANVVPYAGIGRDEFSDNSTRHGQRGAACDYRGQLR